ncbi:mucin-3A-like isoform X2 [Salvelinus alpinus]|uniref:mucin-3A-like isoform X2 n=1 Tax=Salvelinus alpinus TaxID=8036 RepID=UPI0039FBD13B
MLHSSILTDIPQLTVSSTVIRETESVLLSCETPPSLPVSHCYFYIEGEKILPDSSCTQTITGTELLKRSGPTFPAVVKVTCYYTVWKSHTSPLSDPVSVTVQDPKPDITVNFDGYFNIICLIRGSVSPDTTCNLYVGEESQPSFTAKIKKRKPLSASNQGFCRFLVTESDLIRSLQSVRSKEVSCDYRVNSGPNALSPRSDGYSFTHLVGVHISDPTTIKTPSVAETFLVILTPHSTESTAPLVITSEISTGNTTDPTLTPMGIDPKPDITVYFEEDFTIICLIPGSVSPDTSPDTTCNLYVGEESQPSFTAKIKKRKATSASKQGFCQFTPKHSDLVSRLQSVRRKEVSCDYRVSPGPNSLSPRSDGKSFAHLVGVHIRYPTTKPFPAGSTVGSTLTPNTPVRPTTNSSTKCLTSPLTPSTAVNPTSETAVRLWQGAVSVASGVGVFLMGLTAVYLWRRTKKNNSQRPTARQDDHSQCDLVMGAVSCAGTLALKDSGNYSFITTVPSTLLPSGPVEENGKSSENDNSDTYHVYSSIPDRPATSAQPDGLYSLLQTH